MVAARLTRIERKAQTRTELLAAAREVFLRRGFHGASLDEIALEAGYTKGAVYSNFADKDGLFLALLEAHYAKRVEEYTGIMLEGDDLEDALRGVAHFMGEADEKEPTLLPLLSEFIAHVAHDEPLRLAYAELRRSFLGAIARLIAATGDRYAVTFRLSPLEIARTSSILVRGFSAERQVDPDAVSRDFFVEVHTAFLHGLIVPAERSDT